MIGRGLTLTQSQMCPHIFPTVPVNRHQASVRELEETHHTLTKPPQGYARIESMAHVCDRSGLGILQNCREYIQHIYTHSHVIRCNKAPRPNSSSDSSCVLPMHHGRCWKCSPVGCLELWWHDEVFSVFQFCRLQKPRSARSTNGDGATTFGDVGRHLNIWMVWSNIYFNIGLHSLESRLALRFDCAFIKASMLYRMYIISMYIRYWSAFCGYRAARNRE